jgi:hypothetical protein
LNKIGNWVDLIALGKVDWTHCEVAAQVVKKWQDLTVLERHKKCATVRCSSRGSWIHERVAMKIEGKKKK